jgi:ABC-type multidrug transport system fused ATPase/permease subunit
MSSKSKPRRLFVRQFFLQNTFPLILSLAVTVILAAVNLALTWLIQQLIDVTTGNSSRFSFLQLTLFAGVLLLCLVILMLANYLAKPRFLRRAMTQYKNYAFSLLLQKNLASFLKENTSTYISALTNDAISIELNLLEKIFPLFTQLLLFTGALAMMLYYSPLLTLYAFLFTLLPVLASLLSGRYLVEAEKEVSVKNEQYVAAIKDSLSGFSVIKSFKAEKEIQEQTGHSAVNAEAAKFRKRKISTLIQMFGSVAGFIAQIGVFLVGAWLSLSGKGVTAGVVIAFVNLMNFLISPIAEVPQTLAGMRASLGLIDKLATSLSTQVRDEGKDISPTLQSHIRFEDLHYAYEEGKPVLFGVDTQINKGECVGLVGASGSGKSTLLHLLMGGSTTYEGNILLDNTELRDVSTQSLYDLLSMVQQNVFIFNSSIRDNITMFRDFPDAQVNRAVELSGLKELLLKRGEDYLCGENGVHLSGGERQRIAIARALLRENSVLLMDEATASLDPETARHISESIFRLDGLTRIVVTHRLEDQLLSRYDKILALKDGKILESGTFKDLMDKKGYFYSLYTVSQ